MNVGGGIHNPFPAAVARAVMLFHVFHLCVFLHEKTMDAGMRRGGGTAVMDAAAGYDRNIAVLSHKKVVVHALLQTALAKNHRNVHALPFRARFDPNVDAGTVLLRRNIYMSGGISSRHLAVGTDIVRALRHFMQVRHLLQ